MAKNWIAGAVKKPGALHKEMGIPQGKPIPGKKLAKAAEAGGKLGQRARLAETFKGMKHPKQTTTPVKSDRGGFGIKG
jgi:hypothetical protein